MEDVIRCSTKWESEFCMCLGRWKCAPMLAGCYAGLGQSGSISAPIHHPIPLSGTLPCLQRLEAEYWVLSLSFFLGWFEICLCWKACPESWVWKLLWSSQASTVLTCLFSRSAGQAPQSPHLTVNNGENKVTLTCISSNGPSWRKRKQCDRAGIGLCYKVLGLSLITPFPLPQQYKPTTCQITRASPNPWYKSWNLNAKLQ